MRKVFGLGLPKTGTSSLNAALTRLGYRVKGPGGATTAEIRQGEYGRAFSVIEQYDAFEGMPWSQMAGPAFERYGADARYVLTVRRSPEVWLTSIRRHMLMRDPVVQIIRPRALFSRRYPLGFEREYLEFYDRHNNSVRELFVRNGAESALLEVCWETGGGWAELCAFLGHDAPQEPFPKMNVTADRKPMPMRVAANTLCARIIAGVHRLAPR